MAAAAPASGHRPGPGLRAPLFHRRRRSSGPRLPRRPAHARPCAASPPRGPCWSALALGGRLRPPRLERLAARPLLGAGGGRRRPLLVRPRRPCRSGSPPTSGRSTSGSRLRTRARGSATSPSRRRSAPCCRRPARRSCSPDAPLRALLVVPAASRWSAVAVVFIWLAPVVLAPLFNKFAPLPRRQPGSLRGARRSATRPGSTSARSTGSTPAAARPRSTPTSTGSARPSGSSSTTTCSDGANRAELRSVVAHELGHVKHDDILRGLAFVASSRRSGCCSSRAGAGAGSRRDPRPIRAAPAALPATCSALAWPRLVLASPRQPALAPGRGAAPTPSPSS